MMTSRERVLAVLNGEQPDQVPWFADLDYYAAGLIARGERPAGFRQSPEYLDWHRELGAGFYLQGYMPFQTITDGVTIEKTEEGNLRHRTIVTPRGTLSETWQWSPETVSEAPVERLVKDASDLAAYRYYYEHMHFEPDYGLAEERSRTVGEDGVVLCYTPRSPFMRLVTMDAGIEHVVSMFVEAQDELDETVRLMKKTLDTAVEIAVRASSDIIMIPENLSSEVVGPAFFEMYMMDFQRDWIHAIHDSGKFSTIHIDGTLKGLLRQEAENGFTFIEAMTPSPVGDLPVEEWMDYIGDTGAVAWGGLPGVYFTPKVSDDEFDAFVRRVLETMTSEPRYVLGVADQVPPDGLESRIRRVRELADRYGAYR